MLELFDGKDLSPLRAVGISLMEKNCQHPHTGGDFFDGKDLTHPRARVGFMTEEISHSPRAEIFPTEKILHRARGVGGFFLRKRFDLTNASDATVQ